MSKHKLLPAVSEALEGRYRQYRGVSAVLIKSLGAGLCLFALLYVSGVLGYAGVYLLSRQYNALFLSGVVTMIFLLVPGSKGARRDRLPWYDILLILGGLAGNLYIFINALDLSYHGRMSAAPSEIALASITILVLMEAVRRTMGWSMLVIVAGFLAYARFGYLVTGALHLYPYSWSSLVADIYLGKLGIYGDLLNMGSTIIISFITFAVFFTRAGAGKFFMNLALALAGQLRGGPAKVAVIGSALFGTLSGSPAANVAAVGVVTIPLMKQYGYRSEFAGAVEAVASTGGVIMPPVMGSVAFVMASMLEISYTTVCIMAAIPAILYFTSVFMQVDLRAAREGLRGLPRDQLPSISVTLKQGWELTIPFVVLVVLLFVVRYPPTVCAVYATLSVIIVSLFRKENRLNIIRIGGSLEGGLKGTMEVAALLSLAGILLGVLVGTGLGPKISSGLVTLFGERMLLLVVASGLTCYIMGMGISMIASYVLVAVLVAPALSKFGLPLPVAHFFILYMVTSTFFTPPYCTAAFVASAIANANPFRIGFQAMRLGIVCFLVPFIIIYQPALLQIGEPWEIALATVKALFCIFALSVGIEGYLFTTTSWVQRVLFLGSGVMVVAPGVLANIIGAGILGVSVLWQWQSRRRSREGVTVRE